jgi:cellulose synthase/poly-beta-1,6-N-acetylglucosamine synthase-like glycosyltransferase
MIEPKITIIVPAYNEEENIELLLDSLINLNYTNYEIIIVIDSKTNDNTSKKVKQFSLSHDKIKLIQNTENGSAANRNKGFEESEKDTNYYAFTDGDCIVDKNWLKILVNTMEHSPENTICVGGINPIPKTDSKISKLFAEIEKTILGAGGTAQTKILKQITEVNSIPNCNALYKKRAWENNKQDESLIVGQDGEFNHRLHEKGGKFFINPNAIVLHHRPDSLKKQLKKMFRYGEASSKILKKQKNKIQFIKKRWYGFLPLIYYILLLSSLILSLINKLFLIIFWLGICIYLLAIIFTTIQIWISFKKIDALKSIWIIPLQHLSYTWGVIREL